MTRPLLVRKDTRADEDRQRRAVTARDGNVCQFEREYATPGVAGYFWRPCGRKGATDTAHVYRRRECGKARFSPDVAIKACRDCHDAYDQSAVGVRVSAAVEARAWSAIAAVSKVLPPRQNLDGLRL